jgi:carboxyl-terminal processing protease
MAGKRGCMRSAHALVCSLVTVAFAWPSPAAAQPAATLLNQARAASAKRDHQMSARLYAEALARGADDPMSLYEAAAGLASAGRKDEAFEALARAVDQGLAMPDRATKEPEFESLRADARWSSLIERMRASEQRKEAFWKGPALKTPYQPNISEDEKVAGLSRLWSEVKFNFANFDLVPALDWDALYLAYLPKVRRTRSTLEYYRVLMELNAKLNDGHTNVFPPGAVEEQLYSRPLVRTRLVEEKVLILRVDDEALTRDGIVPGAEVVAVDGVPVRKYGEEQIAPYQASSTRQDREVRTYEYMFLAGPPGPFTLTLRDASGKTWKKRLERLTWEQRKKRPAVPGRPAMELKMLPGNVAHVALNTFEGAAAAEQFEARFAEIAKADAIVFDIRENDGGSSNVGFRVLACLTDRPFRSSKWRTRDYRPTLRAWGFGEMSFGRTAPEVPPNAAKQYRKPVAVLTSPRTFSAAEDFALAFDLMERGPIVGEPTGGSTGQPLFYDLPGGGSARVCTKRDSYPDGRDFVGVGVQPDILVRPTVTDFRAGRDPVLEAALQALKKK